MDPTTDPERNIVAPPPPQHNQLFYSSSPVTVNLDISRLQDRINSLEASLSIERGLKAQIERERDEIRSIYVRDLKDKEKIHREKVAKLEEQIRGLKDTIMGLETTITELRENKQGMEDRITRLENNARIQRHKLLVGTLSYTYVECAIEFVFSKSMVGAKKLRSLKNRIHSIEELEEEIEALGDDDPFRQEVKERFATFQSTYYDEEYDECLRKMAGDRVGIAHPLTECDEDDDPPPPKRMEEIILKVYASKRYKKHRETACAIVNSLDKLRRDLSKQDLFG